jgi:hypothetical protein
MYPSITLPRIGMNHRCRFGKIMREGVYCGVSGPTYESKAEIGAMRTLGTDTVGMSTVPEVIKQLWTQCPIDHSCVAADPCCGPCGAESARLVCSHQHVCNDVTASWYLSSFALLDLAAVWGPARCESNPTIKKCWITLNFVPRICGRLYVQCRGLT